MRILYVGKFQPFHSGHLNAINVIKSLSKEVIVAVGSPKDERYFSLEERIEMVEKNTSIIPKIVEDLDSNHPQYKRWGRYVLDVVGNVDIVATGNPRVMKDFYQEGKHVLFFNRDTKKLSGTVIRNFIEAGNDSWKSLVPEKSLRIVELSEYYRRFNNERR